MGGCAIETRKIILRLLLGALALAAAAGVLAAMLPSRWFVLRVSGTGVVTAVAAGLALPASMLLVRERTRPAGLLAMVLITVEFLLALALMWLDSWFSSAVEERIGITMGMVALCGIGLFIALLLLPVARSRLAGLAGVVTAGVAFASFMIATWIPPTGSVYTHDEWWGTGWTLGGCGLLAAATLFGVPPGRWVSWRWAAVAFTGIVAAIILLEIWTLSLSEELLSVLVSISIVLAYANLCLEMPLKPGQRLLAWAAIAAAAATAVFIDLIIVINDSSATDLLERLAAAGGIVTGCATMAIVVLLAFNRRTELPARAAGLVEMTAVCPRCRRKQQLPIGDAACSACGLKISIRIEEPSCPECGYLLYQLTSDRCPECGRRLGGGGGI